MEVLQYLKILKFEGVQVTPGLTWLHPIMFKRKQRFRTQFLRTGTSFPSPAFQKSPEFASGTEGLSGRLQGSSNDLQRRYFHSSQHQMVILFLKKWKKNGSAFWGIAPGQSLSGHQVSVLASVDSHLFRF